jgi:hypothetical protein
MLQCNFICLSNYLVVQSQHILTYRLHSSKIIYHVVDRFDQLVWKKDNKVLYCSYNPSSSAYSVFIWQLIRYARACSTYDKLFHSRQATDKQVGVTEDSKISFTRSIPAKFTAFIKSSFSAQPPIRSSADWCVLYQLLYRSWHSNFDFGLFRSPDLK